MRIRDLITAYLDSRAFRNLAHSTKAEYLWQIKLTHRYLKTERDSSNYDTKLVDQIYAKVLAEKGDRMAWGLAKVMRKIWNWGIRQGYITANPWNDMRIKMPKARTIVWTKKQYQEALETCDKFGFQRLKLLMMMCYYLGQRPGDCLTVPCANLHGDNNQTLTITQGKVGKTLHIYVPMTLREELVRIKTTRLPQFQTVERYPETFFHETRWHHIRYEWQQLKKYLHWPADLKIADLRRTAITEFGDAQATDQEIRAVGGHSMASPIMENVYAKRTFWQSYNAMKKRFPEDYDEQDLENPLD